MLARSLCSLCWRHSLTHTHTCTHSLTLDPTFKMQQQEILSSDSLSGKCKTSCASLSSLPSLHPYLSPCTPFTVKTDTLIFSLRLHSLPFSLSVPICPFFPFYSPIMYAHECMCCAVRGDNDCYCRKAGGEPFLHMAVLRGVH